VYRRDTVAFTGHGSQQLVSIVEPDASAWRALEHVEAMRSVCPRRRGAVAGWRTRTAAASVSVNLREESHIHLPRLFIDSPASGKNIDVWYCADAQK
jgi:hypothetical protein